MDNVNTLDNLLQIETQAAAMVNDAQKEADKRVHECETKHHASYEEHYRAKVQELEASLQEEKEKTKLRYQNELEEYRKEVSAINSNAENFSALLNDYLSKGSGRNNA